METLYALGDLLFVIYVAYRIFTLDSRLEALETRERSEQ